MELDYLRFLCLNLLNLNQKFKSCYEEYWKSHHIKNEVEFSFQEDLVNLMVEILRGGTNYDFSTDDRLEALFDYIGQIEVLENKRAAYIYDLQRNGTVVKEREEFSNYSFADSQLLRFELNDRKKEGKFFFYSALYSDPVQETVDGVNVIVTFKDIQSLKLQGCFDFEFLKGARGYADTFEKISEGKYRFAFACIANYEYFIMDMTFSGLTVENFEYDWDSRYNLLKVEYED